MNAYSESGSGGRGQGAVGTKQATGEDAEIMSGTVVLVRGHDDSMTDGSSSRVTKLKGKKERSAAVAAESQRGNDEV